MNLKEYISENWSKSDFIRVSLNYEIRNQIEQNTSFLNSYYSDIPLRTRAYVILHDIHENEIPKCKCGCGEVCAIDKTYSINGFRLYANSDCSRKDKTIKKEIQKDLQNYDWLYEQRITLQKSIEKIAEELDVSTITIVKYLKIHQIDDLFDGRRKNSLSVTILNDEKQLKYLYDSGLTCETIAEKLNVSKSTVSRWINIHKIETKNPNSYERKIKKTSKSEIEIFDFISSFYDGPIIQSNRSLLNGKELDIYLPEKKFAIEYNGLYYHYYRPYETKECLIKNKKYHLKKTLECEQKGVDLLQFYSDEWNLKKEIIKSIIKSKLHLNQKIYARNCQKVILDTYEKNKFLNENHIQGEDKSKVKIGLRYQNELMCVMTFCKSRFNSKYEWELSRFSSKIGINVIGGFSKLLKWFRQNYSGNIVSYADRRYSKGNVYLKNGFKLIHVNSPSYYYVDKHFLKRFNRMKFQKKYIGAYDCTEYEKARELGYNKIFDCGTLCYGLE